MVETIIVLLWCRTAPTKQLLSSPLCFIFRAPSSSAPSGSGRCRRCASRAAWRCGRPHLRAPRHHQGPPAGRRHPTTPAAAATKAAVTKVAASSSSSSSSFSSSSLRPCQVWSVGRWRRRGRGVTPGLPAASSEHAATCLYLTTYEAAKTALEAPRRTKRSRGAVFLLLSSSSLVVVVFLLAAPWLAHLSAGLIAETVSCVVFVLVVKEHASAALHFLPSSSSTSQQQQRVSANNNNYRDSWHAFRTILRAEGLWHLQGYAATLLSSAPSPPSTSPFTNSSRPPARTTTIANGDSQIVAAEQQQEQQQQQQECIGSASAMSDWLACRQGGRGVGHVAAHYGRLRLRWYMHASSTAAETTAAAAAAAAAEGTDKAAGFLTR